MIDRLCPPSVVRDGGSFKYVRLPGGRFVFALVDWSALSHADMVEPCDRPVSAGAVYVHGKTRHVEITTAGSVLLALASVHDDADAIQLFLWPTRSSRLGKQQRR